MVEMQSARLKRAGVLRHLLEARDFSRVRLHAKAERILKEIAFSLSENDAKIKNEKISKAEIHSLSCNNRYYFTLINRYGIL